MKEICLVEKKSVLMALPMIKIPTEKSDSI
jgi:hypothetical protein